MNAVDTARLDRSAFLDPGKVIRMGVPPVRLEILTAISGVEFADCNKQASGRPKDLLDLDRLS